ncbi:MAG: SH3 domain-containing protein [Lachnospiraceae bacterium]|nr:SH3 domain-containing protein [Lachnospiraceae bacterium]
MKKLRKVLTLAAALLVVVAAVYQLDVQVEAYVQKLGTITSDTSLYESASSSASVLMSLTSGQSVVVNNEVTGTDGAIWYQLYVDNTETGYVPSSVVTVSETSVDTQTTEASVLTTTTTVTTGTITVNSVNVRASASTSSTAVTTLSSGDTFTVLTEETGDDGYVWYQVEFEQNGGTVYGYVRSDLASVSTQEVEVTVDNPDVVENTETETTQTESSAPYRLVSQETAEGETVWYLVEDGSSSGYSVEALLEAANTPVSSSGGGQRVVIVLLVILLIVAAAAAVFFCLRWRDAEALLEEMREQSRRRRTVRKETTPAAGSRSQTSQQPRQASAGQVRTQQSTSGQTRTQQSTSGQTRTQQSASGQTRTQQTASGQTRTQQMAAGQTRTQQSVQARTQQTVRSKPAESGSPQTSSRPAAPTLTPRPKAESVAETKTRTQQKSSYEDYDLDDMDLDDFPSSDDIVKTTRKELKRKQEEPAPKPKTRKSKNFLDDDDDEDLEFDFLKLDDDDE